jgi:DNA-binding NtrC family response regulator
MEKKKILVVDDEQNSREGLTKILIKEGYEVIAAESGEDALVEAKKQDFDLIITDLRMPEISGIDVLEKIRAKKPDIGVIIVTAYGEVNSYLKAMTLGAFEYLNKPIKLDELRRVISKALNQS